VEREEKRFLLELRPSLKVDMSSLKFFLGILCVYVVFVPDDYANSTIPSVCESVG